MEGGHHESAFALVAGVVDEQEAIAHYPAGVHLVDEGGHEEIVDGVDEDIAVGVCAVEDSAANAHDVYADHLAEALVLA